MDNLNIEHLRFCKTSREVFLLADLKASDRAGKFDLIIDGVTLYREQGQAVTYESDNVDCKMIPFCVNRAKEVRVHALRRAYFATDKDEHVNIPIGWGRSITMTIRQALLASLNLQSELDLIKLDWDVIDLRNETDLYFPPSKREGMIFAAGVPSAKDLIKERKMCGVDDEQGVHEIELICCKQNMDQWSDESTLSSDSFIASSIESAEETFESSETVSDVDMNDMVVPMESNAIVSQPTTEPASPLSLFYEVPQFVFDSYLRNRNLVFNDVPNGTVLLNVRPGTFHVEIHRREVYMIRKMKALLVAFQAAAFRNCHMKIMIVQEQHTGVIRCEYVLLGRESNPVGYDFIIPQFSATTSFNSRRHRLINPKVFAKTGNGIRLAFNHLMSCVRVRQELMYKVNRFSVIVNQSRIVFVGADSYETNTFTRANAPLHIEVVE